MRSCEYENHLDKRMGYVVGMSPGPIKIESLRDVAFQAYRKV